MTMRTLAGFALALSGAVAAVAAPTPDLATIAADANARAPFVQVEKSGGIEYLNGGVSLGEAAYVKSRAGEFSLQILFSGRGGEYGVADRVSVRSGSEELMSVANAGPYLLLKLPPGRYTVEASFDGAVERRSVSVGSGTRRVNWNTLKASD
jgi:hypothetical protein